MCPDKKLEWFDGEQVVIAENLVRQRWLDTYERFSHAEESLQPDGSPAKVRRIFLKSLARSQNGIQGRSKWLLARWSRPQQLPGYSFDSINTYLNEPPVNPQVIQNAGGVLLYWEKLAATRPHLARMALDFLTAPGKPHV
jgi:hypothetical protein